jgi:hypothetical protein
MWPFRRSKKKPEIAAWEFTQELVQSAHQKPPATPAPSAGVYDPLHTFGIGTKPPGAAPFQAGPPPRQKYIACMVTHGMGQQVPFETVGLIAEALGSVPFQANRIRLTDKGDLLSRLECAYTAPDGTQVQVHLYEGYWAPLTEGKISFWETIGFLYSGGLAGLRSLLRRAEGTKFSRWMFGGIRDLPIKPGTLADLLLAMIVVTCGVVAYASLLRVLTHIPSAFAQRPPLFQRDVLHIANLWLQFAWQHAKALLLILVALIYTKLLHFAVVEYVGDVAIYVSSYKVSRFEEVRTAIQKTVFKTAEQIYSATRDAAGTPLYDEVVLVGHSLGSVITYDLLNELIVWDQKGCNGRQAVVARTTRLITFGSPLDKTAFLFRTQISADHHYREALACLQQPLILTYAVRPTQFRWYNLYSAADVISGKLVYYDDPLNPPSSNPVINRSDPHAWIPLMAHVQYWSGDLLARLLKDALLGIPLESLSSVSESVSPRTAADTI